MGSLRKAQSKFALCIAKLIVWANEQGYEITLGDTYPGKFKHSPYGYHPKGLAVDLNLFKNDEYLTSTEDHAPLGEYYKSLDPKASWGGDWGNDGNHYSYGEGK